MVVIRLSRSGAKKNPFYHIVAADSRFSRDGRYIEQLGYFNPTARGQETRLELNQERIDHWQKEGAQPSQRIKTLLKEFAAGKITPTMPSALEYKQAQVAKSQQAAAEKVEIKEDDTDKAEEKAAE